MGCVSDSALNPQNAGPVRRPRRLRRSPVMRAMVAETQLHPTDFILPLFIACLLYTSDAADE